MSKVIQKLNKLNNPESFIQVNTIKGFKYVDRAGEIVNAYHKKNVAPLFTMSLNGLVIEEPAEKANQLKITSQALWMKFTEVDSLDMVANIFSKEAEKVFKILEVEEMSRIGWRNYFIYEFADKDAQTKYLAKFTAISDTTPALVKMELKTGKDFGANLVLQPVLKNDDNKTPGVLFDVDVFKSGVIKRSDVGSLLKGFREYLADNNGFLTIVNKSFE